MLHFGSRRLQIAGFTAASAILFLFLFYFFGSPIRGAPSYRDWRWNDATGGFFPGNYFNGDSLLGDVYNTTLGFEDILVVNMPERTDRRDAFSLAATFTNFKVKYIPGLKGETVLEKTIPLDKDAPKLLPATIGSWRAHLNAVAAIVERNLTSALILEDDVDWDIRLKSQLHDFALSSQALSQPLASNPSTYADPSYPNPGPNLPMTEIPFTALPKTIPATESPYGDDWDLLWLGYCMQGLPRPESTVHSKARVVQKSDTTVPTPERLGSDFTPHNMLKDYPAHTRLYHHTHKPVCSTGYALSRRGARKVLWELSVNHYDSGSAYDVMLINLCHGDRKTKLNCLSTSPALFRHWRPRGLASSESDISPHGDAWREEGKSKDIRWSVRANIPMLLNLRRGQEPVWVDQYPD